MADARPTNYKELWNLHHFSLRNIIERAFGVIKQRFQILKVGSQYTMETQIQLFPALAFLTNRLTENEMEEWNVDDDDDETRVDQDDLAGVRVIARDDGKVAAAMRDAIAHQMWDDYVSYMANYR
jgi:hypothetical protein